MVGYLKYSPELEFRNGLPYEIQEAELERRLQIIGDEESIKVDVLRRISDKLEMEQAAREEERQRLIRFNEGEQVSKDYNDQYILIAKIMQRSENIDHCFVLACTS